MSDEDTSRRRKRSDPRVFRRFLTELSWLLSSYESLDFRSLPEMMESIDTNQRLPLFSQRLSTNTNSSAAALVGILPNALSDEAIFPTNEDIADFAQHALGVVIPRWSKKSKYEIIGHIVCHANNAGEDRISHVVNVLESILKNKEEASKIISENKAKGLSWNEFIQELINNG